MTRPLVTSCGDPLRPDGTRTVLRPFHVADPSSEGTAGGRTARIVDRVMSLSPGDLDHELRETIDSLKTRHNDVDGVLDRRFADLKQLADAFIGQVAHDLRAGLFQRRRALAAPDALPLPVVSRFYDLGLSYTIWDKLWSAVTQPGAEASYDRWLTTARTR